jgi:hypothetical protein
MTKHQTDLLSADSEHREAAPREAGGQISAAPDAASAVSNEDAPLAAAARDQLARDIAEIESATAALRKAEPALVSWSKPPAATLGKPRPVWLLVGFLWISAALITVGAAVAIAALVG